MNHYGEFWAQFSKDFDSLPSRNGETLGYFPKLDRSWNSVCSSPFVRALGEDPSSPESRLKQDRIPWKHLEAMFPGGTVPRCDSASAAKVDEYITAQAKKLDAAVKASMAQARFGGGSSAESAKPAGHVR